MKYLNDYIISLSVSEQEIFEIIYNVKEIEKELFFIQQQIAAYECCKFLSKKLLYQKLKIAVCNEEDKFKLVISSLQNQDTELEGFFYEDNANKFLRTLLNQQNLIHMWKNFKKCELIFENNGEINHLIFQFFLDDFFQEWQLKEKIISSYNFLDTEIKRKEGNFTSTEIKKI